MTKDEIDELDDIPVLEGELEWVMKVIDSPEETITGVVWKFSSNNDSTK
jgi:hypothetical protein